MSALASLPWGRLLGEEAALPSAACFFPLLFVGTVSHSSSASCSTQICFITWSLMHTAQARTHALKALGQISTTGTKMIHLKLPGTQVFRTPHLEADLQEGCPSS